MLNIRDRRTLEIARKRRSCALLRAGIARRVQWLILMLCALVAFCSALAWAYVMVLAPGVPEGAYGLTALVVSCVAGVWAMTRAERYL